MAEKRMISKSIIDSDQFLEMPVSAQNLYFHLLLRADDEGFINNPKRIMRDTRATENDMRELFNNQYVLAFESGVVVIRHWKLHNCIRKERLHPTVCEKEKALLQTDKTGAYEVDGQVSDSRQTDDGQVSDSRQTDDGQVSDSRRLRLDKVRLDKSSSSRGESDDDRHECSFVDEELAEINKFYESCTNLFITPVLADEFAKFRDEYSKEWVIEAMRHAAFLGTSKVNVKYLTTVLQGWKQSGLAEPWLGNKSQVATRQNAPAPEIPKQTAAEREAWFVEQARLEEERLAQLEAEKQANIARFKKMRDGGLISCQNLQT